VLNPGGELARVELGPIEPIAAAVARWRDAIGEPLRQGASAAVGADGDATARGEELRKLVLDPVLAAAGDVRTLSICACGPLHLVSLDALPLDRAGTLVGERVGIAFITTFADLLLPHAQGSEDPTLLTFSTIDSGPARSGAQVLPPPSDRIDEVHAVEDAFNSAFHGRELLVSGRAATKAAFAVRSRDASFVHVVTESRLVPRFPRELALAAASFDRTGGDRTGGDRGEGDRTGGILTVDELGALDLSRCEIAVLSASGTHAGPLRPGESIRSLCAAAHRAGARTVLGSLWEIDEAATAELMSQFYARLWIDQQSATQALWGAKMELRKAGRPLRAWAGWVLVGAPD
jgi:CHAT domain-containing protein